MKYKYNKKQLKKIIEKHITIKDIYIDFDKRNVLTITHTGDFFLESLLYLKDFFQDEDILITPSLYESNTVLIFIKDNNKDHWIN